MPKGKPFEISKAEVMAAFDQVRRNGGAGGVDGIRIERYEENLADNLYKLWNRMSSGSYMPKPVKGVEIPKKDGRMRLLGIPTVEDRIAQTVVRNRLEAVVEPLFLDSSYGYRPNKSALNAIGAARTACWDNPWVIEFDIVGLFDNIDHELLMEAVSRHASEKWELLYIARFLKVPMVLPDETKVERCAGTPQGGVISPVLANIFMHYAFDKWMEREFPSCPWERYADDGLIHCVTLKQAQYVLSRLNERMKQCKLEIHQGKTKIVYCRGGKNKGHHENEKFDFLGYTFKTRWYKDKAGTFRETFTPAVSAKAAKSLRQKAKAICRRASNWTIEELAEGLNPVVRGWCNYFGAYRKCEIDKELHYVNHAIARWYRRNHKRVGRSLRKTWRFLARTAKYRPNLFYSWQISRILTVA